jgi:MFS family permease
MSNDRFRGLKAVFKNAVLWGALCGALGGGLVTLYVLFVPGPGVESLPERIGGALLAGVAMGLRFGLAGAIMGILFATAIRLGFRGRRVADLSIGRSALVGAVVGGVGIPVVYQLLNILSGGAIPWSLLFDDIGWSATFGAAAAAGTIWMARRTAAVSGESDPSRLDAPAPFEDPALLRAPERTTIKPPQ